MYLEDFTAAAGMLTLGVLLAAPGARKRARDEPSSPPRSPKKPPRTPSTLINPPSTPSTPNTPSTPISSEETRDAWTLLSPGTREALRTDSPKKTRLLPLIQHIKARITAQFDLYIVQRGDDAREYVFKDCELLSEVVEAWNAHKHPAHPAACDNVVTWMFMPDDTKTPVKTPVMLPVPGITLLAYLERHTCMQDDVLLRTIGQVLSGVHHINVAKQAAHGDLSLNNVLIDAHGHVVIVDVDNAMRSLFSELHNTPLLLEGATCSPSIMSPETVGMYTHGVHASIPADAWAVGMLLLYTLHGLDVRLGTPSDVGGGRFSVKASAGISPIKYPDNAAPYMLWLGGLMHTNTDPVVLHAIRDPPPWAAAVLAGALRSVPATRMDVSALQGCL